MDAWRLSPLGYPDTACLSRESPNRSQTLVRATYDSDRAASLISQLCTQTLKRPRSVWCLSRKFP